MKYFLMLGILAGGLLAADTPRIVFIFSFPNSVPAFVSITVDRTGDVTYTDTPNDTDPMRFHMSETDTSAIFELSGKLDHFTRPLEANIKVAQMGMKTFRWEDGSEQHQVQFNYSQDPNAQALWDWFDRIAETERCLADLDRTVHFDKLGVNDSVLRVAIAWDKKRLVAPEQFLPLLGRVAKDESFMNMARERANKLVTEIQAAKTKAPPQP